MGRAQGYSAPGAMRARRGRVLQLCALELAAVASLGLSALALSPQGAAAQESEGGGWFTEVVGDIFQDIGGRFADRVTENIPKRPDSYRRQSFQDIIAGLGGSPSQGQELTSAAMNSLVSQGKAVSQVSLMEEVSALVEEIESDFAANGRDGWEVPERYRNQRDEEEAGMFDDSERTGAAFMDDIMLDMVAAREAQVSEANGNKKEGLVAGNG